MRLGTCLLLGVSACSFSGASPNGEAVDASQAIDAGGDAALDAAVPNARVRTITVAALGNAGEVDNLVVPVILEGDADLIASAAPDGADLLFQDSIGARLPHDIESYDQSTGNMIAWVRVPKVGVNGTTFEMFYGDGNTAPMASNAWQGLADLVYHFESANAVLVDHSPSAADATINNNGGSVTLVQGRVGLGLDIDSAFMQVADSAVGDRAMGSFAVGAWFSQNSARTDTDLVFFKDGGGGAGYQIALGAGGWFANVRDENDTIVNSSFGDEADLGDDGFVHLVLVMDRGAGRLRAYLNGVEADNDNLGGGFGSVATSAVSQVAGQQSVADGVFDELRLYTGLLSPDYILADHALTSNPSLVIVGDATAQNYPEPPSP